MKKNVWKKILAGCLMVGVMGTLGLMSRKKDVAVSVFSSRRVPRRQLILDAGHGGEDGGAVSLTGVPESNINLAIVLKLDQLLGFYGEQPILLRETDISLHDAEADTLRKKKVSDLHNRVSMIESVENAVVISIHQNTFSNPAYHGAQVFYREGEESKALAEQAQNGLCTYLDPENKRTPKKIPDSIYLMKHITCPAILVECGFLSNAAEEKRLRSDEYQTQLAMCIVSVWLKSEQIQDSNMTNNVI